MDPRKCQTVTVSPAEPGDFPLLVKGLSIRVTLFSLFSFTAARHELPLPPVSL